MIQGSDLLTDDLRQRGGLQVQHDGALLDAHLQLHQAVQRQRGHVRLAPSLATLLHLLLELDPSAKETKLFALLPLFFLLLLLFNNREQLSKIKPHQSGTPAYLGTNTGCK